MPNVLNHAELVFLLSFISMWLAARIGATILRRVGTIADDARDDFSVIQTATLTLLALIIGFTFSMAVGRYDLREHYEEEEASAISTAYLRADLLPAADAAAVRALLVKYLDVRALFYTTRDARELDRVDADTTRLQQEMWTRVRNAAVAQPTPITALVVSAINDVLNTQGYAQAAWWNRIPYAAWGLMTLIAIGANLLVGYGARALTAGAGLLLVVPLVVALAFSLIADIDSPRGGMIHVRPVDLQALVSSLHPR
ncbi:hypothetical protein BJG93_17860 [Paraburkholderia sprentiae WSM5005]|uniref:DUF4239 domain-containing protein n=1 Tax=Paraburkholderia sprentiae WSM5005 TaxID=754502 RepID=A0A1I9YM47_9BURK|nr:hypothetical protein [Paraburkholderia sprentiae]APA87380.1 hypothetical protein BJG93_17860 [Paraburkholderia sprentiae WSM5005]